MDELMAETSEIPFAPNRTEDATKQFTNKRRMFLVPGNAKAVSTATKDLRALVDHAHVGDAKMRAKRPRHIESVLDYENDSLTDD